MSDIDLWPMGSDGVWLCCNCSSPMAGHEPPTCCSGYECGCMGQPTEPNVCSEKCWKELMPDLDAGIRE